MFSVVIPNHNKAPHIHRSIHSVLTQSFTDWEIIFVDDASSDQSLEEIKKINDKRIRIFQREIPGPGGYAARNLGIQKAQFDWVCFLDSDDEWLPNYLENINKQIKENPDISFFGSAWEITDGKSTWACTSSGFYPKNKLSVLELHDFLKNSISNFPPVCTISSAIKKSVLVNVGGFPEDFCRSGGDVDTWLRLILNLKKMGFWNESSAIYHIDSVNMVTRTNQSFETPCLVKRISQIVNDFDEKTSSLLKSYSNKYLTAQIAKSIKASSYNPKLLSFFYAEVDPKKNIILKFFKFSLFRQIYKIYLDKNNPFYG